MEIWLTHCFPHNLNPLVAQNSRARTQVAPDSSCGCNCCQNLPARVKCRRSELVAGFEGVRRHRGRSPRAFLGTLGHPWWLKHSFGRLSEKLFGEGQVHHVND